MADLGAIASTPSGHPTAFNGGTFAGVDPDETLEPAEAGAMGVINSDINGTHAGSPGAPGPSASA